VAEVSRRAKPPAREAEAPERSFEVFVEGIVLRQAVPANSLPPSPGRRLRANQFRTYSLDLISGALILSHIFNSPVTFGRAVIYG